MIGIKVPKNNADKIRRVLLNHQIIKLDMKIKRIEDFVYIPLINTPNKDLMDEIDIYEVTIVDTEFKIHTKGPKSLKDYLKDRIEPEIIEEIKKSFDIIGEVVILEIPEEFDEYKYIIGDAALKFTKRRGCLS